MLHVTNLKSTTKLFFFSLISLSYTGSWDSLANGLNDVDKTDLFTIYVENNQGERIENAWATLSLTNTDQEIITGPPQYIEFNHEGRGRYSARIQPHQFEGRKVVLSVYAEHHEQYEKEVERFEREVRVELKSVGSVITYGPAPDGITLTGNVEARIDGYSRRDFVGGLVFALSADETNTVLGFSYTGGNPNNGFFRIEGLSPGMDIMLVAFHPNVKRLIWFDLLTLPELKIQEQSKTVNLGVLHASMSVPSFTPHDLTNQGQVVIKGKFLALQVLLFAGWIYERHQQNPDYEMIDTLTNKLYEYYLQEISGKDIYQISGQLMSDENSEKETLTSNEFNDVPLAIRNSILSVYNNPCHEMQHPENVYVVNDGAGKNLLYFVWEVGCPLTRGRGYIWVFDSNSGEIVGNGFGYHITGYPPTDLLEFDFSTASAYPDFIFTGTLSSPKPRFVFNNQLNEFEMDYNHVPNSVTDIDDNRYQTVQIGEQIWMAENLRTGRYANGDIIPNITDHDEWHDLQTGAWAYYDNNPGYHDPYGKLYNWFAVDDSRGLCPDGWRVPDGSDWFELKAYLGLQEDGIIYGTGGYSESGRGTNLAGKLMATDQEYWESNNRVANNESGFSGLPGGQRNFLGYINLGTSGRWWSSSDPSQGGEGALSLIQNSKAVGSGGFPPRQTGYSVRCMKDVY